MLTGTEGRQLPAVATGVLPHIHGAHGSLLLCFLLLGRLLLGGLCRLLLLRLLLRGCYIPELKEMAK